MATSPYAPTSGFPALRPKRRAQDDPVPQASVGLPPPPVPPAPNVPAVPYTASNGYGTTGDRDRTPVGEPSGYSTLAPWSLVDQSRGPLEGSAGALDLMPQRFDLALPAKNLPPDSQAVMGQQVASPLPDGAGFQDWLMGGAAAVKSPLTMQMEPGKMPDITAGQGIDESAYSGKIDFGKWMEANVGETEQAQGKKQGTRTESAGAIDDSKYRAQPGYGVSWGLGWYDGTPEGKAAWEAAGSPGPDALGKREEQPPKQETKKIDRTVTNYVPPKEPSLDPRDYKPAGAPVDQGLADWNTMFRDWLSKQMANESPYSTDLIKQGQKVLEDAINRQTAADMRALEAHFAARGLTGSSLEGEAVKDLRAQAGERYRKGLFDLGQAQVDAYLKQTSTVGTLGTQFGANLTDQQQNALASIRDQMSLALQKYGIDKQTADAAADRQLRQEMADLDRESRERMQEKDIIAEYGGTTDGEAKKPPPKKPPPKEPSPEQPREYPVPKKDETNTKVPGFKPLRPATDLVTAAWQKAPPAARETLRQYAERATQSGAWRTLDEIEANFDAFINAATGGGDRKITTSFGKQFYDALQAFVRAYSGST